MVTNQKTSKEIKNKREQKLKICKLNLHFPNKMKDDNQVRIREEGGITPIITALKTHSSNAGVCEQACGALWNIAINGWSISVNFTIIRNSN